MDDEKLIEAVARAIDDVSFGEVKGLDPKGICRVFARAAISVTRPAVIEECEQAARGIRPPVEFQDGVFRLGYLQGKDDAADAIRALAAPREIKVGKEAYYGKTRVGVCGIDDGQAWIKYVNERGDADYMTRPLRELTAAQEIDDGLV